jgi:hypothetical protein
MNQARELHLELYGATLSKEFCKLYAKMLF